MADFPNIRHMRVFLEAARSGSVSQAADRCALSQPAATQAIKRLEQDMGAALLVRRGRRFVPSAEGALFEARVAAALGHLARASRIATRGAGQGHAPLDRLLTAAQLRTLIALSNCGSFTVAARHLGLSQPSVHRSARGLEAAAGVALFRASPSGVSLSSAAQALVMGAKLALSEIRQGIEEIASARGKEQGSFILGSLPLARARIVPDAAHAMIAAWPGTQIRVLDGRYADMLRALREGDIDCIIGALRDPLPADDIVQEGLFNDSLAIVAHPSHPLAARSALTLEDTLAYPWIAPPKETPAGRYLFDTLRIHEREQTPVRLVSSSLVVLRGMLAAGPYVSIISRNQIVVDEAAGLIAPLDIALSGDTRTIGLTTRRDWRPTQAQAAAIGFLRASAARHGGKRPPANAEE